jgi:L-lactate dehydrogenase complex protein LldG
MSPAIDSRQRVLDHIGKATQSVAKNDAERAADYARLPRNYVHKGQRNRQQTLELMIERLREYDAEVIESTPEALPAAIFQVLAASGHKCFVVPQKLPTEWLAAGYDWKVDQGLTSAEINLAEGVVTAAFCAVADSGTIILHHSETEGQRAITLLPDWQLCILRSSQVVETLPEYFSRCTAPPRLLTSLSGPSATADIEMTRIKGVHGPRFLHVILVRDEEVR